MLGQVEGILFDDKSSLLQIENELKEANQILKKVFDRPNVNVSPSQRWKPSLHMTHTLSADCKRATQTANIGTIFSCDGYKVGIHTWSLRLIARPSTCMLGVAPLSVPQNQAIYSTHGHFINLDGGQGYSQGVVGNLHPGVHTNQRLKVVLNCDEKSLSFSIDNGPMVKTHNNISIDSELHLAWANDSTSGSILEFDW